VPPRFIEASPFVSDQPDPGNHDNGSDFARAIIVRRCR
jgi:hypothetical protein